MNEADQVDFIRAASDEILGRFMQPAWMALVDWDFAMQLMASGHEVIDPRNWREEGIYPPMINDEDGGVHVAHLCPTIIAKQAPQDLEGLGAHVHRLFRRELRFLEEWMVHEGDWETCQVAAEEG